VKPDFACHTITSTETLSIQEPAAIASFAMLNIKKSRLSDIGRLNSRKKHYATAAIRAI
jgi:hypothetical protein